MLIILDSHNNGTSDQEFILELYNNFGRLMFATAKKYTSNNSVCEDIIQDSLVKLIGKVSLLRKFDRCVLTSYIVSTVRNTSINHLRRKALEQKIMNPYIELSDADEASPLPTDEIISSMEDHEILSAAWNSLDEDDRFLLEGKYFLDYSDSELAEMLSCKPVSIRMKLTRARRKLMTKLVSGGYQHEKL
ncbi:MAG: RNA polymerase sigma factor [Candidatus Heteroscillospira sp.]|jgi:RNA polymerase sigma-70 factor (ECF subfamily)